MLRLPSSSLVFLCYDKHSSSYYVMIHSSLIFYNPPPRRVTSSPPPPRQLRRQLRRHLTSPRRRPPPSVPATELATFLIECCWCLDFVVGRELVDGREVPHAVPGKKHLRVTFTSRNKLRSFPGGHSSNLCSRLNRRSDSPYKTQYGESTVYDSKNGNRHLRPPGKLRRGMQCVEGYFERFQAGPTPTVTLVGRWNDPYPSGHSK